MQQQESKQCKFCIINKADGQQVILETDENIIFEITGGEGKIVITAKLDHSKI